MGELLKPGEDPEEKDEKAEDSTSRLIGGFGEKVQGLGGGEFHVLGGRGIGRGFLS